MSQKPHLISFETCPFVQRSVITLKEKGIDFDITYIDLANKPDWFLKLSPTGKVPVLQVGDKALFESAVINEYLDEITPPSLHPKDPLQKAFNRAWIEFSSGLNMTMFQWCMAKDEGKASEHQKNLKSGLERLEEQVQNGPFFNGSNFSLIDAAFAPFFMRLAFLSKSLKTDYLVDLPKLAKWSAAVLAKPAVQESVVPDIEDKFFDYIRKSDSALSQKV